MKHLHGHKNPYQDETKPDTLISSLSVDLTAEQRLYLDNHRHLSRTKLAEKVGITRLQVNHYFYSKEAYSEEVIENISKSMKGNNNSKKVG